MSTRLPDPPGLDDAHSQRTEFINGDAEVAVLPTNEKWMGVTYADDKPQVMSGIRTLIAAGIYPANLWV